MKFYLFFLLGLLITSCTHQSTDEKLAYRLMNSFAATQNKQNNFEVFGMGGAMFDSIRVLDVVFTCNRYVDVVQARKIIVPCANAFLNQINTDEQIRPYLNHYPFTVEDIHLGILFNEKKTGRFVRPPNIAFVTLVSGNIIYTSDYDPLGPLTDMHKESYEEALRIVNGEQQK
jgi:hypothetical protein